MKKVLLFAAVAAMLTTSTGCGHKKRVQRLEQEILRCKAELKRVRAEAEQPAAHEVELARAPDEQ